MIKLSSLIFLILACASFFVNGVNGNVEGWAILILANIYSLSNIVGVKRLRSTTHYKQKETK